MTLSEHILDTLRHPSFCLDQLRRGIEKESLRVTHDGGLALTPHPKSLGSALTHPNITTDFSEAQLELITGIHSTPHACLDQLFRIHQFVQTHLGEELLWPSSMPCRLEPAQEAIPLGRYGTSNIGQAKTVYRRGLGNRYGRVMQTISGIHYNFSLPEQAWQALGKQSKEQRTDAYFDLIRNFRRWSWLLIYLLGSSPVVSRSFIRSEDHQLAYLGEGTYGLPDATSLRMGRLGYQSDAQAGLDVSYNSLEEYSLSIRKGLTQRYPDYQRFEPNARGELPQLNDAVLQIENEFYGAIRPKRTIKSGQRPLTALAADGVEYVEVRCLDLDPFEPLGIGLAQIRFLDTFLLLCALSESPVETKTDRDQMSRNQTLIVEQGRNASLMLERQAKRSSVKTWGLEILNACEPIAQALDQAHGGQDYVQSLSQQIEKIKVSGLTPSARILDGVAASGSFAEFSLQRAKALHQSLLEQPLPADMLQALNAEAAASLATQKHLEQERQDPFPVFLTRYLDL